MPGSISWCRAAEKLLDPHKSPVQLPKLPVPLRSSAHPCASLLANILLPGRMDSRLLVGARSCPHTPPAPAGPPQTSALELLSFPLAQATLPLLWITLATFFDRPARFMAHIWWSTLRCNKAPLLWQDLPSERMKEKGTQRD